LVSSEQYFDITALSRIPFIREFPDLVRVNSAVPIAGRPLFPADGPGSPQDYAWAPPRRRAPEAPTLLGASGKRMVEM